MKPETTLSDLLTDAVQHLDIPVYVEVVRRDAEGWITHRAKVEVVLFKSNFDGKGFVIRIDESHIKMEESR